MKRKWKLGAVVVSGVILGVATILPAVQAGGILPPEKQVLEDNIKKSQEIGRQKAVPKPADAGYLPEQPEAWPTGIFDRKDISVPFKSSQYTIINVWQKDVNGEHVQVYAGALAEDSSQGIVIVKTTSLDLKKGDVKRFPIPTKEGAVKIIQENNLQLTFKVIPGKPSFLM